jgi:hypothetical protein
MSGHNMQGVAEQVARLAQRQGYVVERDVREELARAGLPDAQWKDVLALARPSLAYRRGRYYHPTPPSAPTPPDQARQSDIQSAYAQLLAQHQGAAGRVERREQGRVDFVQPVQVITEDNRTLTLLTRDLSATGVRLIGTHRLLGQKLRVLIPAGGATYTFTVRILWTCPVGDDMVENGGSFLAVSGQ